MIALRALWWADVRIARANLRGILRSPLRLGVWIAAALVTTGLVVLRLRLSWSGAVTAGDLARADDIVAVYLATLGVTLAAPSHFIGLFAHQAEARWIATAPVDSGFAIAYVQARTAAGRAVRTLPSFAFAMLALAPPTLPAAALGRDLVLEAIAIAVLIGVALPRELAPPPVARAVAGLGVVLTAAAAVVIARESLLLWGPSAAAIAIARKLPSAHPGALLLDPAPGPVITVAAAGVAIVVVCSFARETARHAPGKRQPLRTEDHRGCTPQFHRRVCTRPWL